MAVSQYDVGELFSFVPSVPFRLVSSTSHDCVHNVVLCMYVCTYSCAQVIHLHPGDTFPPTNDTMWYEVIIFGGNLIGQFVTW